MHLGEIVELKSGGPRMTVRSIDDGMVSCDWFYKKENEYIYKNASFPEHSLLSEKNLEERSERNMNFANEFIRRGFV